MAEFKLTPPVDQNGMGSVYGAPSWLQSALMGAAPQQGPQFPDAPPSYGDREAARTIDAWKNIGNAIKNDPGSIVQMLGMPGFVVGAAAKNADVEHSSGRGQLPLNAPKAAPAAAPVVDLLPRLMDQKTRLQDEIARAGAEQEAQAKTGRGPKWQAAIDKSNSLLASMKDLDSQIADAQAAAKRQSFATDPKTIEAENVRSAMLADKRLPFHEQFPNASAYWSVVPGATAATVHAVLQGAKTISQRSAAGRWWDAIEAAQGANAATKARQADIAAGYAKDMPRVSGMQALKPWAIGAGSGALEGAALANTPEIWDSFAPALNQEKLAYQEYLKRLPADHPERGRIQQLIDTMPTSNPIKDAAIAHFMSPAFPTRLGEGALEGVVGAATGKSIPYALQAGLPRAETASLVKDVKSAAKAAAEKKAAKNSVAEALVGAPDVPQLPSGPMPGVPMLPPPSGGPMPKIRPGQDDWGLTNQLYQDMLSRYGRVD